MSCKEYDSCVSEENNMLQFPEDNGSLYSQGIYDDQIARRKCYQRKPVSIIEGFGNNVLLKVVAVVLLVLLVVVLYCRTQESSGSSGYRANEMLGGGMLGGGIFGGGIFGGNRKVIDFSTVMSDYQ